MAHVLIMPRQGNTVESCIIQEWKVKEGDSVKADTAVCVVETDKATFDVAAGADGQVLKVIHPAGDDVPVLDPIAVVGTAGEDWNTALGNTGAEKVTDTTKEGVLATSGASFEHSPPSLQPPAAFSATPSPGAAAPKPPAESSGAASPRARNLAAKEAVSLGEVSGTGPEGRIIERDIKAALAGQAPLTAAAKAAVLAGAAIPAAGTGIGGRVTAEDTARSPAASGGAAMAAEPLGTAVSGGVTETPIKGIRKLIADRMLASLSESAQFSLNANANAVQIQELRKFFKSKGESKNEADREFAKITVNDIILYAVSRVLPSYQYMNAHKAGDIYRTFEAVHLGMAVDTPRGLMVPVIRNANHLTLKQISAEAKRLATVCQSGTAKPDELSGSTFTVSNLGSFGITGFTPVLNAPEVGILGVCGIELKPVENSPENEDECPFAFAPHIGFSLTINHQVVDGAPAARFLKALCQAVENIYLQLAIG